MKYIKKFSIAVAAAVGLAALLSPCAYVRAQQPIVRTGGGEGRDVYLQSLDIRIDVTGNIASTRYTMVFKNRTDRILDGELTFPLPDGRTVTHYALDVDSSMRSAVPVEKAKAMRVFEEIMNRRPPIPIDPGILEKIEGGSFRTRIYPFPRNGTRTISVGYEEELPFEDGALHYRLPMDYQDPIDSFSVSAVVWSGGSKYAIPRSAGDIRFGLRKDGNYAASFAHKNYRPSRALSFALPAPADIPQVIMQTVFIAAKRSGANAVWGQCLSRRSEAEPMQNGESNSNSNSKSKETTPPPLGAPLQGGESASYYFLATVAPKLSSREKTWGDDLAIIWDVSLSGLSRDFRREAEVLDIIFGEKKNANVHLYFLNDRLRKISDKNAATADGSYKIVDGKWDGLKKVLQAAIYDGGTDFSQINLDSIKGKEVLFFSDGISTLGDVDFIKDALVNIPTHCIVSSSSADYGVMRLITAKTGGKYVNLNALSSDNLKRELLYETPMFLGVEHGSAVREVYPRIATPVYGNFSVAGIYKGNAECRMKNAEWKVNGKVKTSDSLGGGDDELTLLFGFGDRVEKRISVALDGISVVGAGLAPARPLNDQPLAGACQNVIIPKIWAQKKIAELDLEYDKNRGELTKLGKEFGIVTRNTTLMVLELIDDYIRYGIEPPPELQEEYENRKKDRNAQWLRGSDTERNLFDGALWAADFIKMTGWKKQRPVSRRSDSWHNDFDVWSIWSMLHYGIWDYLDAIGNIVTLNFGNCYQYQSDFFEKMPEERSARLVNVAGQDADPVNIVHDNVVYDASSVKFGAANVFDSLAQLQGKTDADYLSGLTGEAALLYRAYLKSRRDSADVSRFYFDMAHRFYTMGDRETAVRVLSSIAELKLEDAPLYRMLGYRLKEYGEHELQKFVFKKVMEWRPMEPQSYRDYALALADNGETQAALDSLYGLLKRSYPTRIADVSGGIEEVVVAEISNLIAKNPHLDISKIDPKLIAKSRVDIRVVLNWNRDAADVGLAVTIDPFDSKDHRNNTDGHINADNMRGYGPKQFMLKNASSGKYRVSVHNILNPTTTEPITIMAEIYTKYSGRNETRQVVTMQLSGGKGETVAEFTVGSEFSASVFAFGRMIKNAVIELWDEFDGGDVVFAISILLFLLLLAIILTSSFYGWIWLVTIKDFYKGENDAIKTLSSVISSILAACFTMVIVIPFVVILGGFGIVVFCVIGIGLCIKRWRRKRKIRQVEIIDAALKCETLYKVLAAERLQSGGDGDGQNKREDRNGYECVNNGKYDGYGGDDDDDDETPHRIRTDAEFAAMCELRDDIFHTERNIGWLRDAQTLYLILVVIAGLFISTREVCLVGNLWSGGGGWGWRWSESGRSWDRSGNIHKDFLAAGGDPGIRVTRNGAVGIVIDSTRKKYTVTQIPDGIKSDGNSKIDIDAILLGPNTVKSCGDGGSVMSKDTAGIGYGRGTASGFDRDDHCCILEGKCGSEPDVVIDVVPGVSTDQRAQIFINTTAGNNAVTEGILSAIEKNGSSLRDAYDKLLGEKPWQFGTITVKIAIDGAGKVASATIDDTTMHDWEFEKTVISIIKKWRFGKAGISGSTTEVVCSFVLHQGHL